MCIRDRGKGAAAVADHSEQEKGAAAVAENARPGKGAAAVAEKKYWRDQTGSRGSASSGWSSWDQNEGWGNDAWRHNEGWRQNSRQ